MAHRLRVERTPSYTPEDAFGDDDNDSELLQSSDLHSDDTFQLPPHTQSKQLINASLPQLSTASYATGSSLAFKLREAVNKVPPTGFPSSRATQLSVTEETDSEFDPPRASLSAKQSIRDVFKNALREPADSSVKPRSRMIHDNLDLDHDHDHFDEDEEAASTDQANLSDSSAPLSLPAANYQTLANKLEEPVESTLGYRQPLRSKPSNQKLHQLLQNARAMGDDSSYGDPTPFRKRDDMQPSFQKSRQFSSSNETYPDDSENRTVQVKQEDVDDHKRASKGTENSPSKLPSPPSTPSSRSESPEPPTPTTAKARYKARSRTPSNARDAEDMTTPVKNPSNTAFKTPRPPGAWSTPQTTERRGIVDSTYLTTLTATPAPPGGWQATPAPLVRTKGILKNSGNLDASRNLAAAKSFPSSLDAKNTSVNIVDSYGRPVEEQDHEEKERDLQVSPSKRKASVRLVDEMGNAVEGDQSLDLDPQAVVGTIQSRVNELVRDIEHVSIQPCPGLSHDYRAIKLSKENRYNELAMAARSARIEREKLKRQGHLVQSRGDEAVSNLQKFKNGLYANTPISILRRSQTTSGLMRWIVLLFLGLQLVMFWIAFRLAQHYIRQYFLTAHYDPFVPAPVDTGNPMPVIPLLVPRTWQKFNPLQSPRLPTLSILNSSHVGKPLASLMPSLAWPSIARSWPPS